MPDRMSMGGAYLVDGTNLLYRAYHALQGFRTSKGLPTHVAYGFLSMVLRVQREYAPEVLAVVFDPPGPTQKHKLYAQYKANRERTPEDLAVQIPYVFRLLEALGIPTLIVEGYEADDVLGTLAQRFVEAGDEITLVTGDKDFCQLVSERVRLLDTMKDQVIGPKEVEQKLGVPPRKVVDLLSLTGDAVDNLPGIPGVGPKTAAQLLARYGSLEAVVRNAGEERGKRGEMLRAHGATALENRALVTIDTAVPIPFVRDGLVPGAVDRTRLAAVLRELEFQKYLKEFGLESEASVPGPDEARSRQPEVAAPRDWLALVEGPGGYWGCAGDGESDAFLLGSLPARWRRPLESGTARVVGHGLKAAHARLRRCGVTLDGIHFDCEVAAYLLSPGRRSYPLEELATDRGLQPPEGSDDPREAAKRRAVTALSLAQRLESELASQDLLTLYRDIENPLIPVLADMEAAGVRVDVGALRLLSREYADRLAEAEEEMFSLAGEVFSPQSPKQLSRILFEKLKLPLGRKTATGYSTDSSVLEELSLLHPLPGLVLAHRSLSKLKGTFIDVLPNLVNEETGRIHASFHQTVTATGRLSSSDPNLQNIPVRGEEGRRIREAFIPADGAVLLSADYSQVELRILAHLSGDSALLDVFRLGRDVHAETASRIFGVSLDDVDGRMRREAKTVNFGILYGISSFGLARQLGIGREAAHKMIEAYFNEFPGIRAYLADLVEQARTRGYAQTLFGRRRAIPELSSRNRAQREFGERMAVNTPIQGTAADLIKRAMIGSVEALRRSGISGRLILQVHDELVFEVEKEQVEAAMALVKRSMEGAAELSVPLSVDAGWGADWYKAH